MDVQQIKLSDLKTYPNNPRKGNVELIADSLATFGQYKPITVNKRSGEILAGNHTFEAAKSLGWKDISVAYVDVDEDTAARIVALDNRAADLGTYDDDALLDLLSSLEDLSHTGYDENYLDDLLATLEEAATPQISAEAVNRVVNPDAYSQPSEGDGVKLIPSVNELAERYNQRATRMVVLDYENSIYIWVVEKLNEYRKEAGLETNSDAIRTLLEVHFNESAPQS
jgi:hypothetical protein